MYRKQTVSSTIGLVRDSKFLVHISGTRFLNVCQKH